ncbi:MAG: germination protein YpeB [Clostridia bacterium]|nr:germination protein YpeB [Clostridia bacterium]
MEDMKTKLTDWKNRLKDRHMMSVVMVMLLLVVALAVLFVYSLNKQQEYRMVSENSYNMSFYELVNCVDEIETYLAKAEITSTPEHAAKTLTAIWNKANLAVVYLSQIPIKTEGLSSAEKFLNQISDYSYSLSVKAMGGEKLSDEDLKNIEDLHTYTIDLKNILNQLELEINDGTLAWGELIKEGSKAFAQQVNGEAMGSFGNIEGAFSEYTGLIYDGAFSEHMVSAEKKGLTGDDIDENKAREIVRNFLGVNDEKIESKGLSENGDIVSYDFEVAVDDKNKKSIVVSKKGGHIVYMNYYKEIAEEKISEEEGVQIGKNFLSEKGYKNMKETYYMKQSGNIVVNYANVQDDVVIYSDLIKVKIALDNGEILGMESAGYLNCHEERNISKNIITVDEAKKDLNPRIEIMSQNLAMIPTEYNTEKLCWEFKGKVRRQ